MSLTSRTVAQPSWEQLPLAQPPNPAQLDNIKAQLDLVLLSIEALTGIGSDAMLQAATELKVADVVADRVALWRLRQSSPLRKGQGRKRLDVEEARALVLITCHLAQAHQELLRRAIALLEQIAAEGKEPHRTALLGDYLDNFSTFYQERMGDGETIAMETLSDLALKLLIDVFFYSAPNGTRRLWMALIDRAQGTNPRSPSRSAKRSTKRPTRTTQPRRRSP